MKLLPDSEINVTLLSDEERIFSEKAAFERYTLNYRSGDPLNAALKEYFSGNELYTDRLKAIDRAANRKDFCISKKEITAQLFGKNKRISASQIEKYNKCRFSYFCNYGLKLRERRKATLDAIEYGNLVHYLLENMLIEYKENDYRKFDDDQLSALLDELVDRYMEEVLGGVKDKTERFKVMYARAKENCGKLLGRMGEELALSDFRPVDFELNVGKNNAAEKKTDKDLEGYSVKDSEGNTVTVRGVIDRVDLMKKNGKDFIRIVDYKTGTKEFRISDILYGINMQMLIYLSAIAKNGKERYGDEIVPSGILYMPSMYPTVSAEPNDSDDKIEKEHDKDLKMNGMILNDPDVYLGMDTAVSGRFVPIKLKKDGGVDSNSQKVLITPSQLKMVFERVDKQIALMSDELNKGRIEAVPVAENDSEDNRICGYCPYKAVCARERSAKDRKIRCDKDIKNVLGIIEQERGEAE